ncbi:hypothetical protein GCM10009872_54050 [Actinopolymorpha rutila]
MLVLSVVALIIAGVVLLAFDKTIYGVILLALGLGVPILLPLLFGAFRIPGTSRQSGGTGRAHRVFEGESRKADE